MLDGTVVHVTGITGSSGSGIAPQAGTHHPSRAGNLKTYKPLEHQHVPEIVQTLADGGAKNVELRFVPVSAPLTRGIFATCFLEMDASVDKNKLAALFDESYAREAFVRRPKARLPEVVAVAGSNYAEVGFAVGPVANGKRTVTCFSAIDNLIKGGAGQAIQNMNLVLGVDERASLEDVGNWP
jgi:[amino group carrier protein]-6-phospho-L-2-aminoadipate/5-phospho-L-glutamate reductase